MTGCIIWQAGRSSKYGWSAKDRDYAHRVAYRAAYGEIPEGTEVHHTCEVKLCVNPAHLEAVTRAEHNRIHPNHHTGNRNQNTGKTHCKHGHEFTPENTFSTPASPARRRCRECHRRTTREAVRRFRSKTEVVAA